MITDGKPLGVLIEHRVYYMDKCLIGGNEAMAPREQITFKHALDGMLTEHLYHSAVRCQLATIGVFREIVSNPELLANRIDVIQFVGSVFVGTEDAKVVHI
jgi:hypothetical protein